MDYFEYIASLLEKIVFFNVFFVKEYNMPAAIFCILVSSIYLSFKLKFINFRGLKASIKIFFEKEKESGSGKTVTSKAAFFSAISGSVGVGSISGVAAALFSGGPGSVFWMLVIGFLIMPVRYAEVFLGHFFRTKEKDGSISNYGPYAYIKNGLIGAGYSARLSRILFILYASSMLIGCTGAILMQANPIAEIFTHLVFNDNKFASFGFSVFLASFSIFIIIGGLKRMINTMEKGVFGMSIVYLFAIVLILIINVKNIPSVVVLIFNSAFEPKAVIGGIAGMLIASFTRIVIATEVGLGTVSFLHGKSQNTDSVREGLLAMMGPFVINFIFITLNSIAVLSSIGHVRDQNGILMINKMFYSVSSYFPYLLLVITFLFGFTTIIAWYFYGESSLRQLTNSNIALTFYKILFFVTIAISGMMSFGVVIRIIDSVVMFIAFPNTLALLLLSGIAAKELKKSKYFK